MTDFTLRDDGNVLEPEPFRTVGQALDRATTSPLWNVRPWAIYDPLGRRAYSHQSRKQPS